MKAALCLMTVLISGAINAHEVTVKMSLSPAGSFEAKSAKLKGEVKKAGDAFTAEQLWIKVEELKTGIDLRDSHFHKHLNAEKFPKITMTQVSAAGGKGTGTLSINDVKKPVNFTYKNLSPNKLQAQFTVKPSEFKLKEAKYMEIGVDDSVEVIATIDV